METNKKYLTIFIMILLSGCGSSSAPEVEVTTPRAPCGLSGTTILCAIDHDGLTRNYLIYVPENYSGQEPVPLLFNLHGYGSNAANQNLYTNFGYFADQDQFVLVTPEGTLLDGETHWAVGSWTIDSTADDISFVKALIDAVSSDYLIDATRVYATGMSNGGYMSYHLACNLSHRIAAIASVTGSMSFETFDGCQPAQPTSVMQIHGTADSVVPINGDTWTKPINDVIDYWVTYNGCDIDPVITAVPDANEDGVISEKLSYNNCIGGTEVHYYRMNGMGHIWPEEYRGDDLRGSKIIWEFLSQYSTQGLIN